MRFCLLILKTPRSVQLDNNSPKSRTGAGGGTRNIMVSIPSNRNRANVHRTFAFDSSSPSAGIKNSGHPVRDNPNFGNNV